MINLQLLHLDDALKHQSGFVARCRALDAVEVEAEAAGAAVRLWGVEAKLSELAAMLQTRLRGRPGVPVTFFGSGDFHHVTGLLLQQMTRPVTVVHFDNHPDWVHCGTGMHCGSWVNQALALPQVARVITLGVCSKDLTLPELKGANLAALREGKIVLYPFEHRPSRVWGRYGSGAGHEQRGGKIYWRNLRPIASEAFLSELLVQISTADIYITIDKDVLAHADAITNWDQGYMRLDDVLALVRGLAQRHTIAGVDVTGDYSVPRYAGSWVQRMQKRVEAAIDQPWMPLGKPPDLEAAARCNNAANLKILSTLQDVMA